MRVAIGDGVRGWSVGDRVFGAFLPRWLDGRLTRERRSVTPGDTCDGWLRQVAAFPADAVIASPAHLDDVEAATLCCAGTTAWSALERAAVGPGDVVVTQGTGGVSLFAVQLATLRGATVIVTSSSDDRLAIAASLGARHGINYRTTPEWDKAVRALTGGEGADLVLDMGGAGSLARSIKATAMDGRVAVIGVLDGAGDASLPIGPVMQRQIDVFGISVGSVAAHRALARAVGASGLRPYLSHRLSWRELDEAVRIQRANEHIGKIGIEIDADAA